MAEQVVIAVLRIQLFRAWCLGSRLEQSSHCVGSQPQNLVVTYCPNKISKINYIHSLVMLVSKTTKLDHCFLAPHGNTSLLTWPKTLVQSWHLLDGLPWTLELIIIMNCNNYASNAPFPLVPIASPNFNLLQTIVYYLQH